MSLAIQTRRLEHHPVAQTLGVELLRLTAVAEEVEIFRAESLALVIQAAGADFAAIATPTAGKPVALAQAGVRQSLPAELIVDVADRETALARETWLAAPLAPHTADRQQLLVHLPGKVPTRPLELIEALAAVLAPALQTVVARQKDQRRVERLEAVLKICNQWNQTHEMEQLLGQMAEAATRLLHAERASIFLHDKLTHTLVGRPAIGVDELRIPDHLGVVGQVLQTGEVRRVDLQDDRREINQQVDAKLGYRTTTLLAVPLRARQGQLLGVFEALNKHGGNFSDEDQFALGELATHAAIALENTQQWEELISSHRRLVDQAAEEVKLIGESPAIKALQSTIRRVADTELAVLILGENGSGKEVVSQSIHYLSRRRNQPFIAVNCAAIAETLLESELFGHEKGAFTDAHEARPGKFELASGGTLFLDEIGDLSRGGQSKLLRVLEEKVVVRVGGSKTIHTDARVVAATNQDLAEMVRTKKFREDLYFRLNVVTLDLPPLRDRGDDVVLLAEHFLADFSRKARRKPPKLSADARKRLLAHPWPGNVRELRNLMERLAYLTTGDKIEAADLAFILSPRGETTAWLALDRPLTDATDRFQSEYIKKAIERTRGNMSEAANLLGLHRSNLYRKMRQLDMNPPRDE